MQRYSYCVGQYLDDLVSQDPVKRVAAVEKLPDTWHALGHEKTKSGLIPLLTDICSGPEEFQMALAKNLRGLVHSLGPESVPLVLPIIYTLFASEDSRVREAMMTAFEGISKDNGLREKELIKICRKLSDDVRWTSQISAAMVICKLSRHIGQTKAAESMSILSELSQKEDPPVRAAVSYNLKFIMRVWPSTVQEGLSILARLSKDPMDSVRVNCPESMMFQIVDQKTFTNSIWPALEPVLSKEESWRVQNACLMQLREICQSAGKDLIAQSLLKKYTTLMTGAENEVSYTAIKQLKSIVPHLENERIAASILPRLGLLIGPEQKDKLLKLAAAESILTMAPWLTDSQVTESLMKMYRVLLNDESVEVKLALFKTIHEIINKIPKETLTKDLQQAFSTLGEDKSYKNRVKTLETLLSLAKEIGQDFVEDKLILGVMTKSLSDSVFLVRQTAIKTFVKLSELFGTKWAESVVLPIFNKFMNHPHYLLRENTLFGIKGLVQHLNPDALARTGSQLLEMSTREKVPCVIVLILQTVHKIGERLNDRSFEENARIMYNTRINDPDSDVTHYARMYSK